MEYLMARVVDAPLNSGMGTQETCLAPLQLLFKHIIFHTCRRSAILINCIIFVSVKNIVCSANWRELICAIKIYFIPFY